MAIARKQQWYTPQEAAQFFPWLTPGRHAREAIIRWIKQGRLKGHVSIGKKRKLKGRANRYIISSLEIERFLLDGGSVRRRNPKKKRG